MFQFHLQDHSLHRNTDIEKYLEKIYFHHTNKIPEVFFFKIEFSAFCFTDSPTHQHIANIMGNSCYAFMSSCKIFRF